MYMMCKTNVIFVNFYFRFNSGLIFDEETESEICDGSQILFAMKLLCLISQENPLKIVPES